jgi:hypothetical protein
VQYGNGVVKKFTGKVMTNRRQSSLLGVEQALLRKLSFTSKSKNIHNFWSVQRASFEIQKPKNQSLQQNTLFCIAHKLS